jgi:two-component system, NtrC family, sensor kinase
MKKLILKLFIVFFPMLIYGQKLVEIEQKLKKVENSKEKVDLLNQYSQKLLQNDLDKANTTIIESIELAQKLNYENGKAYATMNLAYLQSIYGSPECWASASKALEIFEKNKDNEGFISALLQLAFFNQNKGDYPKALELFYKALLIAENENFAVKRKKIHIYITYAYLVLDDLKMVENYKNLFLNDKTDLTNDTDEAYMYSMLGEVNSKLGNYQEAINNYRKGQAIDKNIDNLKEFYTDELNVANSLVYLKKYDEGEEIAIYALHKLISLQVSAEVVYGYTVLCRIYLAQNKLDKALFYGKMAYSNAENGEMFDFLKDSAELLANIYEKKNDKNRLLFYKNKFKSLQDSLSSERTRQLIEANQTNFELENQKNQIQLLRKEGELNQKSIQNQRILFIASLILASLFLGFVFVLYRNNQNQKRFNAELSQQKHEIEAQKIQLENTLLELKETQTQLIHSEKMASLGELTAGIAHEIQNPLNFVNNFSELSVGIAQDLNEEMNRPEPDKEYIDELLSDLTQNQEKINHHGKRASNIVKGMLEHSRASTGEKQLTDINALADEYLRLSYHGLRAKDKSFNSDFKMDFDENLPKIKVIPQDLGRVLLNLFNNAFYAVFVGRDLPSGVSNPTVKVITKKIDNFIEIKVSDNGSGMPDSIRQKIFQPFFTTKPTGEGTGLGLSLSYDIITKGHGGTIEVESEEGVGTTFIVRLPI